MADLDLLFSPRSVAVIGASADPGRLTGRPLRILRRHGFAGEVFVVHPREDEIDGVRCYRSVTELPSVPDVLIVMLRAAAVPAVAREAGRKGVRHLVVLSSGFEETDEGVALSAELRDIAHQHGMGIVGPNSEGLWHLPARTLLTFGSAAMRDDLRSGPIAVLSQSGSIGASVMRRLNDSGTGADLFVSLGNETLLGAADYLSWIVRNPTVRVVACFLEGLRDGRAFLEAASAARAAGIAVVVLKAGASEQGRAASASHTGKISTAATIYDRLFAQAGVIQVGSVDQLAETAAMLSRGGLRAGGASDAGLTVIGLSGGSRSIIADAADRNALPLSVLAADTTETLAEFIPHFGVVTNPVDPTGQVISDPELFPRTIAALATDPATRALLVQYANGGTRLVREHLPALTRAAAGGVPVVVSCLLDQLGGDDPLRRDLCAAGIGYTHDPVAAVELIAPLFRAAETAPGPVLPAPPPADPRPVTEWTDLVPLLAEAGIRVPREAVVPAGAAPAEIEAAVAAAALEPPLVVKPSPDDVAHKSDLGLVFLGLPDIAAVVAAAGDVAAALGTGARAVVQEMVSSDTEVVVVLQDDPDFGRIMGVGLGGFFVELLAEMTYVSVPASPAQLIAAIRGTRLERVLAGYRGRPAVDLEKLADRLVALGDRYARLIDPPQVLELNPLLVLASGEPVAVDSLIERRGAAS
ncbi:acetate--CoA ligase family protein [Jiangella endophytica]|uniref:acetate--CoA ligase family protein n=1 Tax=Jiangella endophytica TaxID=1623398 RepID=UPI000E34DE88|nr:acetate--CoA ligase family protein [Jiangella endophytica]